MQKTAFGSRIRIGFSMRLRLPAQMMRIMRLLSFSLLVICVSVHAATSGQSVSISGRNLSVKEVLNSVEKQTGYVFFYMEDVNRLISRAGKLHVSAKTVPVQAFLEQFLIRSGLPIRTVTVDKTIQLYLDRENKDALDTWSEALVKPVPQPVSGRVVDTLGNPVQGASIKLMPGNKGTVSLQDGTFLISKVDPGSYSLEITLIGYASVVRQIEVTENHALQLEDLAIRINPESMKEVEVTVVSNGIATIDKRSATGSYTTISNSLFNQQVGTKVLDRLGSISNGVQQVGGNIPGSFYGVGFNIRGLNTMTMAITKPLVILDNFEYTANLENINPNDVEDITFLKDAAAASLWGARAANGVIVIRTKKGSKNKPLQVEFNSNVTFVDKPDLYKIPQMSSSDFIDVETLLYNARAFRVSFLLPTIRPAMPVSTLLYEAGLGRITQEEADMQIEAYRNHDVRDDYLAEFYHTGVQQQYALALSGGSNQLAWRLSGGLDDNSSVSYDKFKRYNLLWNGQFKIAKSLELENMLSYAGTKSQTGRPTYGAITSRLGTIPPYTMFRDEQGNPIPLYHQYGKIALDTAGGGLLKDWLYYPAEDYKHNIGKQAVSNLSMTWGLNYTPLKGLKLLLLYRHDRQETDNSLFHDTESYFTRDLINGYSQVDFVNRLVSYNVPDGAILENSEALQTTNNIRGQAAWNCSFNDFTSALIVGGESSIKKTVSNSFNTYGYDPENMTFSEVNYATVYRHYLTGNTGYITSGMNHQLTNYRILSFYGDYNLQYKSRYLLGFSARRDASNMFGLDYRDKWKPLWSSSLGWILSDEPFFKSPVVDFLKLRASYGIEGNVNPALAAVTTISYSSNNIYLGTPQSTINNYYNPGLKWEQSAITNIGVDFSVWNHRLSGSIEYYHKTISDLYGSKPVNPTSGLSTSYLTQNVGELKMNGWDLQLNGALVQKKDWGVAANFIFNYNKDKITKTTRTSMPEAINIVGGQLLGVEGYPGISVFAFKWAGLNPQTGAPRGYLNGHISEDYEAMGYDTTYSSVAYVGTIMPQISGSLGLDFRFKKLTASARFTYRLKYYFIRSTINYSNLMTNFAGHSDFALRWKQPGDEMTTNVPAFNYPSDAYSDIFYETSEAVVTKGDHIRLQYITLNYKLLNSLIKGRRSPVDIYLSCNNVGILWRANDQGLDPDSPTLPISRNYSFGMRLNF